MRATFSGVSGMGSGLGCVRGRPRGLLGGSLLLFGMVLTPSLYRELCHGLDRTLRVGKWDKERPASDFASRLSG